MKGYILIYDTNNSKELMELNNVIFGRVVKIKRNNKIFLYYYSGILDDKKYYRLSNGCYFILDEIELMNVTCIKSDIDINENNLITASEYFRNKFKDNRVVNLG